VNTTPEAAVALLEGSDPVQLNELIGAGDLSATRAAVELLIARDVAASAADGTVPTGRRKARGAARRRRHVWARRTALLTGAALATAAVVFLALPGSEHRDGGPLSEAAALAAQQPSPLAPAGRYYYLRELSVQTAEWAPASSDFRTDVRWWVARDGSGRVAFTTSGGGLVATSHSQSFQAGQYDSVAHPTPAQALGSVVVPSVGVEALVPMNMRFDPERLPTDPAALSQALSAAVTRAARLEPHGIYAEAGVPHAAKELLLIADALQDPMDTPALRSALFTVTGDLRGIAVHHAVSDPLGRTGEAITASEGPAVEADGKLNPSAQETFAVILDPRTTQILAETQYPSDHPNQADDRYTVFTGAVDVATASATSPSIR
jgi:hypothetical protein